MAKLREKIGYALGDAAAGGITWKIMSIAFPFYFTNVFGLTLTDTAALMLIARMFDVVTDPIIGSLADRTQSRWGTYRPWIIFGAIPFGLIFAMLFYTPEFGAMGNRIYAYSLYLIMMAVYTMVNVPYGSLLGVMTSDDNEKNQFSAFRMVGAYAMGFITLISFPYLQKYIGGEAFVDLVNQSDALAADIADTTAKLTSAGVSLTDDPELVDMSDRLKEVQMELQPIYQHVYATIGLIFGVIAALMTLACGFLTKERLKPVRAEKFSFRQFVDLFRNKPWIYLTIIGISTNFFNGFRYAVAAYIFTYCLGGDVTIGKLIINYTVFMAFGEVTCMLFGALSPKFTQWVGSKRMAFVWAAVICCVLSIGFFFIPMSKAYIWVMIALVVLTSIGVGLYSPLLWSLYSDVADYATEKFGASSTGLIFSSGTMSQKLGGAVSGALITLLLGWAGATMLKDEMGNETIDPASVTESVRTMIWAIFSLFPAVIAAFMGFMAYKFPLKK